MKRAYINDIMLLIDGNDFCIDLSSIDNIKIDFDLVALNNWKSGSVYLISPNNETISYLIDNSFGDQPKYLFISEGAFNAYHLSDFYLYDSFIIKNNNIQICLI